MDEGNGDIALFVNNIVRVVVLPVHSRRKYI